MAVVFSHTTFAPQMTSLLNITGSRVVEDPSFRYKMPRLVCRIEGRGNGIRTCIVNLSDVSSALNRPPDILTKYFGVELGAQSRYEMDSDKITGKSTVNGAHTTPDLQRLIGTFCDKFVLCPKCLLPETALAVSLKKGLIFHKCSACGAKEPADMSHKLCTYIIKQAETTAAAAAAEEKAAAGGGKKGDKDKGEKKVKKEKKEKKEKKAKKESEGGAEAAAAAEKGDKEAEDEEEEEEEEEEEDDEDDGKGLIKKGKGAAPAAPTPTPTSTSIPPLGPLVAKLLTATGGDAGSRAAVKGKSGEIFAALEWAALDNGGALLKFVPVALQGLYDADTLSEETIVAWYNGVEGNAGVKAKAKPLIDWFAEAEEEEEED